MPECFDCKAAAQVLGKSVNRFNDSRDDMFYVLHGLFLKIIIYIYKSS